MSYPFPAVKWDETVVPVIVLVSFQDAHTRNNCYREEEDVAKNFTSVLELQEIDFNFINEIIFDGRA